MYQPIRMFLLTAVIAITGCNSWKPIELYHQFPGNQWARYNLLSFEIPVEKSGQTFDVVLFAGFTPEYQYNTLDFNMILRTASGEERINEYQMPVKSKDGKFLGVKTGDTSRVSITLKRGLNIGKAGVLKIEIENLVPRLATTGITGLGIRLVRSGE